MRGCQSWERQSNRSIWSTRHASRRLTVWERFCFMRSKVNCARCLTLRSLPFISGSSTELQRTYSCWTSIDSLEENVLLLPYCTSSPFRYSSLSMCVFSFYIYAGWHFIQHALYSDVLLPLYICIWWRSCNVAKICCKHLLWSPIPYGDFLNHPRYLAFDSRHVIAASIFMHFSSLINHFVEGNSFDSLRYSMQDVSLRDMHSSIPWLSKRAMFLQIFCLIAMPS